MKRLGLILSKILLLGLIGCAPVNEAIQDLRRANSESSINNPDAERRRTAVEPVCWWDQPYETVCERGRGGGQVCRPVPAGQPVMRCIGAGPQFPYRHNR